MMEKTKKESFWQRWKFSIIGGIIGLLMGYVFSVVFYSPNNLISIFFPVCFVPKVITLLILCSFSYFSGMLFCYSKHAIKSVDIVIVSLWLSVWGLIAGQYYKNKINIHFTALKKRNKLLYIIMLVGFALLCFALFYLLCVLAIIIFFMINPPPFA